MRFFDWALQFYVWCGENKYWLADSIRARFTFARRPGQWDIKGQEAIRREIVRCLNTYRTEESPGVSVWKRLPNQLSVTGLVARALVKWCGKERVIHYCLGGQDKYIAGYVRRNAMRAKSY